MNCRRCTYLGAYNKDKELKLINIKKMKLANIKME